MRYSTWILTTALALISEPALSETASRVYKLCLIEDPSCAALLRQAYHDSLILNESAGPSDIRFCPKGRALTDEQIIGTFMQMAERTPTALGVPVDQFEAYVLQFALPCGRGENP